MSDNHKATLARWFLHPEQFVREALLVENPTTQQQDALLDWGKFLSAKIKRAEGKPTTPQEAELASKIGMSIHSGHFCGKDAFAAWLILHFLICTYYPKIICTAPTDSQLRSILWSEIHKWLRASLVKQAIGFQAEKVFLKEENGKEWFAIPRTVSVNSSEEEQAETIAGYNAPYKLIIVDEASGVPDAVFRPLEGGLAGKLNVVLMIGNPTKSHGFFYASHYGTAKRDTTEVDILVDKAETKAQVTTHPGEWITKRWNAENSEIVNQDHVKRMERKYGRDSNAFRIRILGLPPTASPDALVPWDWLLAATTRDLDYMATDPLAVGVDVARYGDDLSVITCCRGMVTVGIKDYQKMDGPEIAGWVQGEVDEHAPDSDRGVVGVGVDIIGVGASVYDHLNRFGNIQRLYAINVAEAPALDTRFERLRDEILWHVREEFQQGIIKIPNHAELMHEANSIKWSIQPSGKIKVESKKDMKKRGLGSPNYLDSYALARRVRKQLDRPAQSFRMSKRRVRGSWATG